jgi:hypothetical protein
VVISFESKKLFISKNACFISKPFIVSVVFPAKKRTTLESYTSHKTHHHRRGLQAYRGTSPIRKHPPHLDPLMTLGMVLL